MVIIHFTLSIFQIIREDVFVSFLGRLILFVVSCTFTDQLIKQDELQMFK